MKQLLFITFFCCFLFSCKKDESIVTTPLVSTNAPDNVTTSNMVANTDPMFDSVNNVRRYYDLHLKASSPLIDKGAGTGVTLDLDGNPRPVGLPDLGCYEHQ